MANDQVVSVGNISRRKSFYLSQTIVGLSRLFIPDIYDDVSTGPRGNAYVLQNRNYYAIKEKPLRTTGIALSTGQHHSVRAVDTGYYRTVLERLKDDESKELSRKICLILGREGE